MERVWDDFKAMQRTLKTEEDKRIFSAKIKVTILSRIRVGSKCVCIHAMQMCVRTVTL
jgi:hypothetical protein